MNGLSAEEWDGLQRRLEQARDALLRQLADDLDHGTDLRTPARHEAEPSPADNASQRTLNALAHEAATLSSHQLDSVRRALARFADQSYGLCDACGETIGYSRLNARPEARFCINCQTRIEQQRR